MQLDLIQHPRSARLTAAIGQERRSRRTRDYPWAARLPESLWGDLVAFLSFATAIGIVLHLIWGIG